MFISMQLLAKYVNVFNNMLFVAPLFISLIYTQGLKSSLYKSKPQVKLKLEKRNLRKICFTFWRPQTKNVIIILITKKTDLIYFKWTATFDCVIKTLCWKSVRKSIKAL